MSGRYACFISYRHAKSRDYNQTLQQIQEALSGQLAPLVTEEIYRDPNLNPGEQYNAAFAEIMCHSYCLVVIYTPTYKESEDCRGEFKAMCDLQAKRFEKLGSKGDRKLGMIIPIVLCTTQGEELPNELLTGSVHHANLSEFYLLTKKLAQKAEVKKQIAAVAQHIAKVRRMMIEAQVDLWCDCQKFEIPRGVAPWGGAAGSASPAQPPFPFRKDTQ
jgi:hypothetical protein